MLKVVIKRVNEKPTECLINNSLESMQRIINGDLEFIKFYPGVYMVCDEEGKLRRYRHMNFVYLDEPIYGDVFFIQMDTQGNYIDLTDKQIKYILHAFELI